MHLRILTGDLDRLLTPIRRRGFEDRPPIIPADAFGRDRIKLIRSYAAEAAFIMRRDSARAVALLDKAIELTGWAPKKPPARDIPYSGADEATRSAILETIRRLPADAAQFALEQCAFASVGVERPGILLRPSANQWLVVLEERVTDQERHAIVAREIAHAWTHQGLSSACDAGCEKRAAGLTRAWGFT